ncbi:P-II family nitrogen regulator [Gudongella oleilytica]|uniref:P-II family nitrogen regulator n=1 Tax=Gudongella oleilytica TaxID=1582259 RepID=UPI002A362F70|nr:P-II family nitrogen regulator [Gudongella oleilytica]MDY0256075.1 P-II family nitrogen regulator [Gudongella oleilytica]
MPNETNLVKELVLITVIVDFGKGSRVLRISRDNEISGGTVLVADGTIRHGLLNFLGITDSRKEMIMMAAQRETADKALEALEREMEFTKPNHGIAYMTQLCKVSGAASLDCIAEDEDGEGEYMYQVINAIVDKGKAEEVIEAASNAGSKGGTIINARGAGIHETRRVFAIDIEPEKEIVMIIAKNELVNGIIQAINERLEMDKPGNGIIFVQKAIRTYGLYE